jgi:hypothetical protein
MTGPDINTPESHCPHCKVKLDKAFGVGNNEKKVEPGNISLCTCCGGWSVYGPDLQLTKANSKLLAEIKKDRNCQIAYHATMKFIRDKHNNN